MAKLDGLGNSQQATLDLPRAGLFSIHFHLNEGSRRQPGHQSASELLRRTSPWRELRGYNPSLDTLSPSSSSLWRPNTGEPNTARSRRSSSGRPSISLRGPFYSQERKKQWQEGGLRESRWVCHVGCLPCVSHFCFPIYDVVVTSAVQGCWRPSEEFRTWWSLYLKVALLRPVQSRDLQHCFGFLGEPFYAWAFTAPPPVGGLLYL